MFMNVAGWCMSTAHAKRKKLISLLLPSELPPLPSAPTCTFDQLCHPTDCFIRSNGIATLTFVRDLKLLPVNMDIVKLHQNGLKDLVPTCVARKPGRAGAKKNDNMAKTSHV